jgi:citrate synthase
LGAPSRQNRNRANIELQTGSQKLSGWRDGAHAYRQARNRNHIDQHGRCGGREPSREQRFFLDLLLVSIAEHGLVPTNQVARMTYDADPSSLQGAVAAGIMGCGSVVL